MNVYINIYINIHSHVQIYMYTQLYMYRYIQMLLDVGPSNNACRCDFSQVSSTVIYNSESSGQTTFENFPTYQQDVRGVISQKLAL